MREITEADFTRINNDRNGNPRYVIHFLSCEPASWAAGLVGERYARTVKLMNRLGGRRYHNKSYGGGIVFQSYDLRGTCADIAAAVAAAE